MKTNIVLFEEYKLLHDFMFEDEPLKKWINEDSFVDIFKEDWNAIMPVVIKCLNKQEEVPDRFSFELNDALLETNIDSLHQVVLKFIKKHNEVNKL